MRYGKQRITCLTILILLVTSSLVYGFRNNDTKVYTSSSPSIVLQEILRGNKEFTLQHNNQYFEPFLDNQTPNLTVVTCSDSRVHTNLFGIDPNNRIFAIRNIGNQITNSEGSVDYGIRHLATSILMVMGHSNCGAIKAAMSDYSDKTHGIKSELSPLKTPLGSDPGWGSFNERWAKNIERNVDYQVSYAQKTYQDKVKSGELIIIGAVYDFNNMYEKGRGALVITNINGETNPDKFMKHSAMRFLTKNEIIARIGSLAPQAVFKESPVAYGYHPRQQ
ncbi:carbonic anhydrase [Thermodesulfobacteriota bacterium]